MGITATYTIQWRGEEVTARILDAARQAIDETMGECVVDAQRNVPVVTGTLRRSITIHQLATKTKDTVAGVWGSADVVYALAVETGNRADVKRTDSTREGGGERGGAARGRRTGPPLKVTAGKNTGNRNFLRGAADKEYPDLGGRIRGRLR